MKLNEEYFRDLEISDDDIVEDEPVGNEWRFDTVADFHEYCVTKYPWYIGASYDHYSGFPDVALIEIIKKNWFCLFDCYGIEHSDIFLRNTFYYSQATEYRMYDYGYKFFTNADYDPHEVSYSYVICYVDFPKMTTKTLLNFLKRFIDIIHKKLIMGNTLYVFSNQLMDLFQLNHLSQQIDKKAHRNDYRFIDSFAHIFNIPIDVLKLDIAKGVFEKVFN